MERLFIGAYWTARKETIHSASVKIYNVLKALTKIEPDLARLKFTTTIKSVDRNFDLNDQEKDLVDKLSKGILENKRSDIRRYYPGLTPTFDFHEPVGFVVSFEVVHIKKMQISIVIGDYSEAGAINNFLLKFPSEYNYDYLKIDSLFKCIVQDMEPNWGMVVTRKFLDEISKQSPPELFIGWMNYFSSRQVLQKIPSSIRIEDFRQGILTYTTASGEIFSSENKIHTGNALEFIQNLRQSNINRDYFERSLNTNSIS